MEILQATFYILWIIFLFGIIIFMLTAFILMIQLKNKADETMDHVKKKSDEVKQQVDDFVSVKRNEMLMKGAGMIASKVMDGFKKKK